MGVATQVGVVTWLRLVYIMDALKKTVINDRAMKHNNSIVEYCRTSLAVIAGATAGILGLTGLYGFAFYVLYWVIMSFLLVGKAGTRWNCYFQSRRTLWTDGLLGGLFTYVLVWTFLYGMVHVF